MIRLPPSTTLTYTRFPDTTLFRSHDGDLQPAIKQTVLADDLHVQEIAVTQLSQMEFPCLCHLICVVDAGIDRELVPRSEEHTSELQSLMRISYAVFCLKKTN